MESSDYGSPSWQAHWRGIVVSALHQVLTGDRHGLTASERIALVTALANAIEESFGKYALVVRQAAADQPGPLDYEMADPYDEAAGWRSAADCGRCGDTGRVREAYPSVVRQTPELLAHLRQLYMQEFDRAEDRRVEAGLSAVLETVLRPQIVAGFCRCKRGRRLAETPRAARERALS